MECRATPATFTVNTTDDTIDVNPGNNVAIDANGNTSLRAAIDEANALGGSHTIGFNLAGTNTIALALNLGKLQINAGRNITINGPGKTSLFVTRVPDNNVSFGLIEVAATATLSINNVTLTGGWTHQGNGGALLNNGDCTVEDCNINYNEAVGGGGIANLGSLVVRRTTMSENTATQDGGALFCGATANSLSWIYDSVLSYNLSSSKGGAISILAQAWVYISGSAVGYNTASDIGGGIYVSGGTLEMVAGSSLSGNAADSGAGLYNSTGWCDLEDTTISDNTASTWCGGIYAKGGGTSYTALSSCTFANNSDMGGAPKVGLKQNAVVTFDANCVGINQADLVTLP